MVHIKKKTQIIGMETGGTQVTQYLKPHRVFFPLLVDEAVHPLKRM